jgi:hypothetical protein
MKFLLPDAEGKNCEFKRDFTPSAGIKRDLVLAGVLDRTASFTLSELVRRGILERIGKGKSTKYIKK